EFGAEFRISVNEFSPGQFSLETCFGGWHSTATLQSQTWYHLVVTYDGGESPVFYLNGELSATGDAWLTPQIDTTASGGSVGDRGSCGGGYYLNGKVDEVMVFDHALTADEVKQLYDSQRH